MKYATVAPSGMAVIALDIRTWVLTFRSASSLAQPPEIAVDPRSTSRLVGRSR